MTLDEFHDDMSRRRPDASCPVIKTLNMLMGKWSLRLIFEQQKQKAIRFGAK